MISASGIVFEDGIHLISGRVGSGKSSFARRLFDAADGTALWLFQEIEHHITTPTLAKELASWGVSGSEEPFCLVSGMDFSRDPYTLSRGELKRFLLACILASDAECLILDEPYASLDAEAKEILTALLAKRGGTVILFSHESPALPAVLWKMEGGLPCRI